jgi:uncharacterized delta-60 repeat protein
MNIRFVTATLATACLMLAVSMPTPAQAPSAPQGVITVHEYRGLEGSILLDLTGNPKFPNGYDATYYAAYFEWPQSSPPGLDSPPPDHVRDRYGIRMAGFFHPDATREYTFHLCADDQAELYLSSDADPAKKVPIAREPEWNSPRNYLGADRRPNGENRSRPIALVAGSAYYIEARMKEGTGGDNLSVSIDGVRPIPGNLLSSFDRESGPVRFLVSPASQDVAEGASVTWNVDVNGTPPYAYEWLRDGNPIPGATGPTYPLPAASVADHGAVIRVRVTGAVGSITSGAATLTVRPDTTPPRLVKALRGADQGSVTVLFDQPVEAASAGNSANYRVDGGVTVNGAALVGGQAVRLSVSPMNPGTRYVVTANGIRDRAATPNTIVPDSTLELGFEVFTPNEVRWQRWSTNGNIGALYRDWVGGTLGEPAARWTTTAFESGRQLADEYRGQGSTWFIPATTGEHRFVVCSDNNARVFLSSNHDPAGRRAIAAENAWSNSRSWSFATEEQHSELYRKWSDPVSVPRWGDSPILLEAGRAYSLEVIWQEDGGGDGVELAILGPGETFPAEGSAGGTAGGVLGWYAGSEPRILVAPRSQNRDVGQSATLSVTAEGALPLGYQWYHDGQAVEGARDPVLTLANLQAGDVGRYWVVVTNAAGSTTSSDATLSVNTVTVDGGFNPSPNGVVYAWAVQADRSIVVGGGFNQLGGVRQDYVGWVSQDGALLPETALRAGEVGGEAPVAEASEEAPDAAVLGAGGGEATAGPLLPGDLGLGGGPGELRAGANSEVFSLGLEDDGRIVLGGNFTSLGGVARRYLGRLNVDGSLDAGFGAQCDGTVYAVLVQPDGRILVGGNFTTLGGQPRRFLGRLNSDGTLDTGFDAGLDGAVYSLALQGDGKVLVGGAFTAVRGWARRFLARLNSDGGLDLTFDSGANSSVFALAVQADGRILAGGGFTTLAGQARNCLGRLQADGTADPGFNPGASSSVVSLVVQADGGILVGGYFTTLAGLERSYLGRLHPDGTADLNFNPGANGGVLALGLQPDGRILVGGSFSTLAGQARGRLARLVNTAPATQSLTVEGSHLVWRRGGAAAEIVRADFAHSTDGLNWTPLGLGTRVSGGWAWAPAPGASALPEAGTLRARGWVAGGYLTASGWPVEAYLGAPAWIRSPANRSSDAGTAVTFGVIVGGDEPFAFEWRRNGEPLADGEQVSGSRTATLRLNRVFEADEGVYTVVVGNARGLVTSPGAVLTVQDPAIAVPPASENRELGQSVTLTVTAAGTGAFDYQWYKDGNPVEGARGASLTLPNLQASDAARYTVTVSGLHGTVTSVPALLTVNQATAEAGLNPAPNSAVYSLAAQGDGRWIVGGAFTTLGGQTRNYLGRLNADGSLEAGFDPGANGNVSALAVQDDGRILVGGAFTALAGRARNYLGRLSADGVLEAGFDPGANGQVYSVVVDPEGRILVGGQFTTLGGQPRNYLARLNADGSLDSGFNPGANSTVVGMAVQADGKIVVVGEFTSLAGQSRSRIARLNSDGTLDPAFGPAANSGVYAVALQPDGKILVGGDLTLLGGLSRSYLGRLEPDGSVDAAFDPGANSRVFSLALQTDGRILVGGNFWVLAGVGRTSLGRLHPDGTPDLSFNPAPNSTVYALGLQADGKVLVGGFFSSLGGQARGRLGRLNNTGPATRSLTLEGTTLDWRRGGTGPEVSHAVFEHSADGVNWSRVGAGVRGANGWQWTGATLPAGGSYRSRGRVMGGYLTGSDWLVESYLGAPAWIGWSAPWTRDAGSAATFTVLVGGTEPLSYQWLKDGVVLADGGNIAGATTATLRVNDLLHADEGTYTLVASNGAGSLSRSTLLSVQDPGITVQPANENRETGQSVTLAVTAAGTGSLSYQWHRDGLALEGATGASLTRNNLQPADAGRYTVTVTGPHGSTTSTPAALTVNTVTADGSVSLAANSAVYGLAIQPDGAVVLGGAFTTLGGQPRGYLGRLLADGTLDGTFNPGANANVYALALQPDGGLVVGGSFTTLGGQSRNWLGRLNPDGAIDSAFDPNPNSVVYALAIQGDGRILVGGQFTSLGGQSRNYLGRLNPDGTLDPSFNPVPNNRVNTMVLQGDGKIVVGGFFGTLGGQPRNWLGRLNPDGTVDAGFNPGANGAVNVLALQSDGKILVGGDFTVLGVLPRLRLGRLNPDGTVDESFNPGANATVHTLALQADGMILAGGQFSSLGGVSRSCLGRLNPAGLADLNFNPGANSVVYALGLGGDGRLFAGGFFSSLAGQARSYLGRLNATGPATQSLVAAGPTLTWLRGGTGAEVTRADFEHSADGVHWTAIGEGTRIAGGWQRSGETLPAGGTLRGRGRAAGAYFGGSTWLVDAYTGAPAWVRQPANRTNDAGTTATFSVVAGGTEPFDFQWRKDGMPTGGWGQRRGIEGRGSAVEQRASCGRRDLHRGREQRRREPGQRGSASAGS